MPRVDGLEVARYVIDNFPDILVIILSGYEDFEYARKANTFNVHEYLLKPLSARKIRELLKRIHQELDRRKAYIPNFDRYLFLQDPPGYTVSAGVGSACSGLGNLFESFNQALYALENRMIAGDNGVFCYHRDQSNSTENNRRFLRIQSSLETVLWRQKGKEITSIAGEFCSLLKDSGLTVSRIRL